MLSQEMSEVNLVESYLNGQDLNINASDLVNCLPNVPHA